MREKKIPVYPALGNHDLHGDEKVALANYFQRFPDLKNSRYYSMRAANMIMLVLDSSLDEVSGPQGQWLAQKLDHLPTDVDFVVLVFHHPPYTSSSDAKVFGGDKSYVPLIAPGIIRVMVPRNNSQRLLARIVYTGPVPAPITKGQLIGKLKVWRGENLALELPLQAADDVGRGSMSQRAMDGATELMIGVLRAGVSKL